MLRQEAVGMYEAAVLEAGSAAALKRWMDDHGYKYPTGMDAVCEEYVKLGWCFVAEKAKVGGKANVDPKPRMKGVDTKLHQVTIGLRVSPEDESRGLDIAEMGMEAYAGDPMGQ